MAVSPTTGVVDVHEGAVVARPVAYARLFLFTEGDPSNPSNPGQTSPDHVANAATPPLNFGEQSGDLAFFPPTIEFGGGGGGGVGFGGFKDNLPDFQQPFVAIPPITVLPSSCELRNNSYRQADELEITIPFEQLPVDSRFIAAIGIVFYMGEESSGVDVSLIMTPGNIRFSGMMTTHGFNVEDEGRNITLSFVDMTAFLLGLTVTSDLRKKLNWTQPLPKLMVDILHGCSRMTEKMDVICVGGWDLTKVAKLGKTAKGPKKPAKIKGSVLSPTRASKSHSTNGSGEETVWDLITDLAVENGLIAYIDCWQGTLEEPDANHNVPRMVLAQADCLLDANLREAGLPYISAVYGNSGHLPPETIPEIVIGQNASSYRMTRKYGYEKVPSVLLKCRTDNQLLTSQWPPKGSEKKRIIHPMGLWDPNEVREYPVFGYETQTELDVAAQQLWNELGSMDISVEFATGDMWDPEGRRSYETGPSTSWGVDYLGLRAGSPVLLTVLDRQKSLERQWALDPESWTGLMAASLRRMQVTEGTNVIGQNWYVTTVTMRLDDSGFDLQGTAVAYLGSPVSPSNAAKPTVAKSLSKPTDFGSKKKGSPAPTPPAAGGGSNSAGGADQYDPNVYHEPTCIPSMPYPDATGNQSKKIPGQDIDTSFLNRLGGTIGTFGSTVGTSTVGTIGVNGKILDEDTGD